METNISALIHDIKTLISESRNIAYIQVNKLALLTNYWIGQRIVHFEQSDDERAQYGKKTLIILSEELNAGFGRGYSVDNLELMRSFYLIYGKRFGSEIISKSETLSRKSLTGSKQEISVTLSRILQSTDNKLFKLSWSHFVELIKMDQVERNFYETEAISNIWSVRELRRQYNSSLYERIALSRNKKDISKLADLRMAPEKPSDLLRQPYVLEFLGLKEETTYSESDLEQAIINKIELFLLELGKGFLFEARQKRISFEGDDFYIDLVFYNRMLRCYVLIDLKIGKLTHGDIGQMQMYVNYYDRQIRLPDENKTVGIILCKQNNKTVVEFTLPEDEDRIFSREYKLYLPNKEELKKQLEDNIEQ